MDRNNNKILLVLALMFFVLTINRFFPEKQEDIDSDTASAENDMQESIVMTEEDLEMAQELTQYLESIQVPDFCSLDVECIYQMPELPMGCEVTSLAIVLQYMGFQADKCDLSDNYLEKEPVGSVTPYEAFWGDPRSDKGYGCFAPVLVRCANAYFERNGIEGFEAVDLSGSEFEALYAELNGGHPVIVWNTIDLEEPYVSSTWKIHGELFHWVYPLHCVVLTGYDAGSGIVKVSDPLRGSKMYSAFIFKDRYLKMGSQAVVIREKVAPPE